MDDLQALLAGFAGRLDDRHSLTVDGPLAIVRFGSGRTCCTIETARISDRYVLTAPVLAPRPTSALPFNTLIDITWRRNRHADLVAFLVDNKRRLVARIEQPSATLEPGELRSYLLALAIEADRLRAVLTGAA